jgi:hypothetical protein
MPYQIGGILMQYKTCQAIIKTGDCKGLKCGNKASAFNGKYVCGKHR